MQQKIESTQKCDLKLHTIIMQIELRPPFNKLIFIRIIMIKYSETNSFDSKPRNILPKNYKNMKMLIK